LYQQLNHGASPVIFNLVAGTGFFLRFLVYAFFGIGQSRDRVHIKSRQMYCYAKNCLSDIFLKRL